MKDRKVSNVIIVVNPSLNQETLKKHIKTLHEGQKKFKCDACGKSFTESGNLKKHIKTLHEGQRN